MNINKSTKLDIIKQIGYSFEDSKTHLYEVVIYDLFQRCVPIRGNEPLIIEGYVLADGQGDYAHMRTIKKALHKKFPERILISYIAAAQKHKGKFIPSQKTYDEAHIAYHGNSSVMPPTIKTNPFDESMELILEKIIKAGVWFSGPIGVLGLYDSLENESLKKKIQVQEYNLCVNRTNIPVKTSLQMGLPSRKTLCYGISTANVKSTMSYTHIVNKVLKKIFLGSTEKQSVEKYLENYIHFFCYFSIRELLPYIERAIIYGRHYHPEKNIDIIYPGKSNHLLKLKLDELELPGIAVIKTFVSSEGEIKENSYKFADEGIELRIIDPGLLSNKDFKTCMFLSQPLVGCTGNTSVSLALSYGKIPDFELIGNTANFNDALVSLVGYIFKGKSPLWNYLAGDKSETTINDLLDPNIIEDAKTLGKFIKEHFAIEPIIQGLANSILCCKKYPEFAVFEEELKEKFYNGEIGLQEVQNRCRQELQKLNLFPF